MSDERIISVCEHEAAAKGLVATAFKSFSASAAVHRSLFIAAMAVEGMTKMKEFEQEHQRLFQLRLAAQAAHSYCQLFNTISECAAQAGNFKNFIELLLEKQKAHDIGAIALAADMAGANPYN